MEIKGGNGGMTRKKQNSAMTHAQEVHETARFFESEYWRKNQHGG